MIALPNRLAAVAIAALGLSACSSGARSTEAAPQPAVDGTAYADSVAIAQARADSLRYPYTEADVRFMSGMIGHHAQAIAIARWAPTHGASPSIRTLAARIINAQRDEIATMQQWLRERRQPVPEPSPDGMMMTSHAAHHGGLQPGMLTEDQMQQLDRARGAEFDRLFLTFMIQHHRGALVMVKELFGTYGAGQDEIVFKFASDVNVDQITEIERMEKMLIDLLFEAPSQ